MICGNEKMRQAPQALKGLPKRINSLLLDIDKARPGICPERALLWTDYFRKKENRNKAVAVQIAQALSHVLNLKTARIYPEELLVGNFTSRRIGGLIQPELAGITALMEINSFPGREENPLDISKNDRQHLTKIIPFWLRRNLAWMAHTSFWKRLAYFRRNISFRDWVLNELGGIAHFAPDYAKLLRIGVKGILEQVREKQSKHAVGSESWSLLEAMAISGQGLIRFGERYANIAFELAKDEGNPTRKEELQRIAEACRHVPGRGARTFHEALQSTLFAHIAIFHEGLDVSICLGRMDQFLYPYYEKDIADCRITKEEAKELLACFCIKLCETIPVFSAAVNRLYSGLPSYQTVCVGGTDQEGNDAVNDLSYLLLEVVDELRMREPNFHARIHKNSSNAWLEKVYGMLSRGANTPALYNDEVIVPALVRQGVSIEDAREYTPIGCVEPTAQGKSFASTDAALVNVPAALERALNQGRRFGELLVTGVRTKSVSQMSSMDDLKKAFLSQLENQLGRLIDDLRLAERANADHHPTPLSSMLIEGCIEKGLDVTKGGAQINFSGIQCVGPVDVGDSLAAVEEIVFREKRVSLDELVAALKKNLPDGALAARLSNSPKFGNDNSKTDKWTKFVIDEFVHILESHGKNTRGGQYVAGLYSTTTHTHFGCVTGALPNGRRKGEPFASGIAPSNGRDKNGPTALLNSMNRLDFYSCPNGINFNIKFAPNILTGGQGADLLRALFEKYFSHGGMQAQINVLDIDALRAAQAHQDKYPNLLVRVSGYSAYFGDLTKAVQDEIIARTENNPG